MMKRSFAMLPGIGPATEKRIWQQDILHWNTFLGCGKVLGISGKRKRYFDALLRNAGNECTDPSFLASFFPDGLHWRLYPETSDNAAFIDIETSGLSRHSAITVVGIYRNREERMISLVKGLGLNSTALREALKGIDLLVSYNGSAFDLPFLRSRFPTCLPRVPHFDLRTAARKLGYTGGLKSLERRLGIERDYEVEHLAGEDALIFWKMWSRDRNRKALHLLRKYNREDVENLLPLADILYRGMKEITLGDVVTGNPHQDGGSSPP